MFSAFGNIVGRPLGWFLGQSPIDSPDSDGSQSTSTSASTNEETPSNMATTAPTPHEPSVLDVLVVKAMLNQALSLPVELINTIVDMAEYWPHSSVTRTDCPGATGGRPGQEDVLLTRSNPLGFTRNLYPANTSPISTYHPLQKPYTPEQWQEALGAPNPLLEHPCRKIVFKFRSHDQGWSGDRANHGSYRGSYTWFDAGLQKFDRCIVGDASEPGSTAPPTFNTAALRSIWPEPREAAGGYELVHELLQDQHHMIQANVHARNDWTEHTVVWSWTDDVDGDSPEAEELLVAKGRGRYTGNGEFVRSLVLGDVVTAWARARFGAWRNFVESVQIDVYWAV